MSAGKSTEVVSDATVSPAVIDILAVQTALRADGLDGWLLYDFRGLNSIAVELTGVNHQSGHLATRRWYYLIPAAGEPRGLVHAIERHSLAHLPGTTERYAGRDQLEAGLRRLLQGLPASAMDTLRPSNQTKRADSYTVADRTVFPAKHLVTGKQELQVAVRSDALGK